MISQSNWNILTVHFKSLPMKLGEFLAVKFPYIDMNVSNCEMLLMKFFINYFKYTFDKCQRYL